MAERVVRGRGIIAASCAIAAGAVVLTACSGDDPPSVEGPVRAEPTTSATADAEPRFATIHLDRDDGCAEILTVNTAPVSDETADADNRYFGDQLMGEGSSGNVRSVGRSSCGNLPVIVVGMKISTARLPAYGPGGTPVMAYRQREIVAF